MKPLIILPFGMTADVAARIIQCWEHNDSDTEENQPWEQDNWSIQ